MWINPLITRITPKVITKKFNDWVGLLIKKIDNTISKIEMSAEFLPHLF